MHGLRRTGGQGVGSEEDEMNVHGLRTTGHECVGSEEDELNVWAPQRIGHTFLIPDTQRDV